MIRWFFVLTFFLFPGSSQAAIVISEIAWMGSVDSANDEWIELQNTGSSQVVDGWLLSDGGSLEIELAGTIEAGQFAVLERTDDDSAPGSAFVIYAGALTNAGTTLTLRDDDGVVIDQVAGGENWSNVGGDNVTKETAQLTTGGWVTADPTPGFAHVADVVVIETTTDTEAESDPVPISSGTNSDGPSVSLALPDHDLKIDFNIPSQVYVNQAVALQAVPTGIGSLSDSLAYHWNYGDGEIGQGEQVTHTYIYPGQYVVVVEASYARHKAQVKKKVMVLPVNFSITRNSQGDIQIHNDAKYEIDLSGYVVQGLSGIELPSNTFLLAGATLTLPAKKINAHQSSLVALIDTEKTIVAFDNQRQETRSLPVVIDSQPIAAKTVQANQVLVDPVSDSPIADLNMATGAEIAATSVAAVIASGSTVPKSTWPYLGLIGVLALGFGAIFLTRGKVMV